MVLSSAVVSIEESHGRLRTALRRPSDGGTPPLPPAASTVPPTEEGTVPPEATPTGRVGDATAQSAARGRRPKKPKKPKQPWQDPVTGKITDGRSALLAARRRRLVQQASGVATLDSTRCESWLLPHVTDGAAYAYELLGRITDPALARLAGATADAHTMFRGMLALAASGDKKATSEARAWLREHRACLRELAVLSGLSASTTNNKDASWLQTDGDGADAAADASGGGS